MSKSSTKSSKPQQPNTQRRLALLAILLGLLVGVAFVYVYISSDSGSETPAAASRSDDSASGQGSADAIAMLLDADNIPVAGAKGINNSDAQPTVGHPAPNFVMQYEDGSSAALRDLSGRPILINFWATWCPPCRREMPDLIEAYETHKDEGLIVIEVNSAETAAQVADFVEQFNVTAPVILDARNEVMTIYRTNSLPASFFIDRAGVIQAHWPGFMDKDTLDELLGKIL